MGLNDSGLFIFICRYFCASKLSEIEYLIINYLVMRADIALIMYFVTDSRGLDLSENMALVSCL
jgi:hypothetical protein